MLTVLRFHQAQHSSCHLTQDAWWQAVHRHLAHPAYDPLTCWLIAARCHLPFLRASSPPQTGWNTGTHFSNPEPLGAPGLYLHSPPEYLTDTPGTTDTHQTHRFSLWPLYARSWSMATLLFQKNLRVILDVPSSSFPCQHKLPPLSVNSMS